MNSNIRSNKNQAIDGKVLITFIVALVLMALPIAAHGKDKKNQSIGFILSQDATAKEIGLPAYPGGQRSQDTSDDSSALQMGLWGGDSGFKLVLLKLDSNDSPEKIAAFYRKALAKYGSVLDCSNPASRHPKTKDQSNTLECDSDQPAGGGFVFKAGTPDKQHVVAVEPDANHSKISLVYVQSPVSESE